MKLYIIIIIFIKTTKNYFYLKQNGTRPQCFTSHFAHTVFIHLTLLDIYVIHVARTSKNYFYLKQNGTRPQCFTSHFAHTVFIHLTLSGVSEIHLTITYYDNYPVIYYYNYYYYYYHRLCMTSILCIEQYG